MGESTSRPIASWNGGPPAAGAGDDPAGDGTAAAAAGGAALDGAAPAGDVLAAGAPGAATADGAEPAGGASGVAAGVPGAAPAGGVAGAPPGGAAVGGGATGMAGATGMVGAAGGGTGSASAAGGWAGSRWTGCALACGHPSATAATRTAAIAAPSGAELRPRRRGRAHRGSAPRRVHAQGVIGVRAGRRARGIATNSATAPLAGAFVYPTCRQGVNAPPRTRAHQACCPFRAPAMGVH